MTSRGWAGLTGAVGFPIGVVVSWFAAANAGWVNPWMSMFVLPPAVLLGPFAGCALGWFASAFLEGAMEERYTRRNDPETNETPFVPPPAVERINESKALDTLHRLKDERKRE